LIRERTGRNVPMLLELLLINQHAEGNVF
jgi:hypothetical protein